MQPTIARWLFIALIALVIWRLIPLSTEAGAGGSQPRLADRAL